MQGPRGFPGPQQFPDFHHEGARFHGPPHGHGMPPEPFFQRGSRPPYRGGMGGRHDGFPMAAHGHGPPGGGFEGQFSPPRFHGPNDYNNFNANNRDNNSGFNMKRGGRGRGGRGRGGHGGGGHSFEQVRLRASTRSGRSTVKLKVI